MSTDLRDPASKPPGPEEKPKPALSLTQVVGGALAAMTAAALGSRLSLGGTIVGAALASVVAAVAGAVYTSSLRRTSKTVSTVWRTVVRPDGHGGTETVTEEVTQDGTVVSPAVGADDQPTAGLAAQASEPGAAATPKESTPPGARRRIGWKPVAVAAVLMFAIAAVALTGLELATGRALSGGTGTTVGQVAERQTDPTPEPTVTRSPSPSPTETPSSSASDEPSASASSTPSSAPTAQPTPTTAPDPTPTTSAAPSATASAPSASAGASGGATP